MEKARSYMLNVRLAGSDRASSPASGAADHQLGHLALRDTRRWVLQAGFLIVAAGSMLCTRSQSEGLPAVPAVTDIHALIASVEQTSSAEALKYSRFPAHDTCTEGYADRGSQRGPAGCASRFPALVLARERTRFRSTVWARGRANRWSYQIYGVV